MSNSFLTGNVLRSIGLAGPSAEATDWVNQQMWLYRRIGDDLLAQAQRDPNRALQDGFLQHGFAHLPPDNRPDGVTDADMALLRQHLQTAMELAKQGLTQLRRELLAARRAVPLAERPPEDGFEASQEPPSPTLNPPQQPWQLTDRRSPSLHRIATTGLTQRAKGKRSEHVGAQEQAARAILRRQGLGTATPPRSPLSSSTSSPVEPLQEAAEGEAVVVVAPPLEAARWSWGGALGRALVRILAFWWQQLQTLGRCLGKRMQLR